MSEPTERNKRLLEDNKEILDKLEEWTSTQPHIPKNTRKKINFIVLKTINMQLAYLFFTAREILYRYFKVCRCDIEETKKLIDINVKFRIKHQYFLANRDINSEELQRTISNV